MLWKKMQKNHKKYTDTFREMHKETCKIGVELKKEHTTQAIEEQLKDKIKMGLDIPKARMHCHHSVRDHTRKGLR